MAFTLTTIWENCRIYKTIFLKIPKSISRTTGSLLGLFFLIHSYIFKLNPKCGSFKINSESCWKKMFWKQKFNLSLALNIHWKGYPPFISFHKKKNQWWILLVSGSITDIFLPFFPVFTKDHFTNVLKLDWIWLFQHKNGKNSRFLCFANWLWHIQDHTQIPSWPFFHRLLQTSKIVFLHTPQNFHLVNCYDYNFEALLFQKHCQIVQTLVRNFVTSLKVIKMLLS